MIINTEAFQNYIRSKDFLSALELPENIELDFFPLGQGEYNLNYWFIHPVTNKKLVLRINTGSQMHLENQIAYEFSALQDLSSSGRTPKPLFYDASKAILPYGILVMEWLPGRPLNYHTDLTTAAHIFADIHTTPVPADTKLLCPAYPLQAIYEECLEMAEHYFTWEKANPTTTRLLKELITEIGRLPLKKVSSLPPCIVNTEVNSGNFLINDDSNSYLIDWEKPLLSEPAQDLAHFLVPTTTFWKTDVILTPKAIRHFIKEYEAAVDGRIDLSTLKERFPLFFTVTCLRGVTWCAMAMREYSQPDRILSNADTFAKIKDYLSSDFLNNILENYVRKDFLNGDA